MPRDGQGVYRTPAGTDGVPGRTVESAKYNNNVHDVETDLNLKRPIVSGGTGASSASEALVRLNGEQAYQTITDYNTAIFSPGSFKSATTALNGPVAAHAFSGICYTNDGPPSPATSVPPNVDLTIEARDQTSTDVPGLLYVRQKKASVWGPWTEDGTGLTGFVRKTGDTMSGNLTIAKVDPALVLNKPGSGSGNALLGRNNGVQRWTMQLGDNTPETGLGGGSDFTLYGHAQDGALLASTLLKVERRTGYMTLNGSFNSFLTLNRTVTGGVSGILGSYNGVPRWQINLGNQDAETGSGAGSNFDVHLFNDAGGLIGTPLSISRNTGIAYFSDSVSVGDDLDVGDNVNIAGDVGIGGTLTLHDNCAMDLNITIGGQGFKPGGGAWAASSDARIKKDVANYSKGLDAIKQLQPRTYKFKANDITAMSRRERPSDPPIQPGQPSPRSLHYEVRDREFVGLIAQEAEQVMPEMVSRVAGEIDGTAVTDLRQMDTTSLIYALVNACKELAARVEALETK